MDDDQILMRGGDEGDIRKMAEQNGADLNYVEVENVNRALDLLWSNQELQDAIAFYGKWNDAELNKWFKKTKKEVINEMIKNPRLLVNNDQ